MLELSIIVPIYNVEKYLEECIDSIEKIKKIKFEIIMIDDGSSDNSLQIAEKLKLKYKNILLIIQNNKGVSCARNIGLKNAKGRYVLFVDSDDLVISDELEKVYMETIKLDLDIAIGNHIRFSNLNELKKESKEKYDKIKEMNVKLGRDFFSIFDRKNLFVPVIWQTFYKKDFLIKNDLFFKEGIIYEDVLFSHLAISKALRVKYIHSYFYLYRQREGSIMNDGNGNKKYYNYYYVIKELAQNFRNISTKELKYVPISLYYDVIKNHKVRVLEVERALQKIKGVFFYKIRKNIMSIFISNKIIKNKIEEVRKMESKS